MRALQEGVYLFRVVALAELRSGEGDGPDVVGGDGPGPLSHESERRGSAAAHAATRTQWVCSDPATRCRILELAFDSVIELTRGPTDARAGGD